MNRDVFFDNHRGIVLFHDTVNRAALIDQIQEARKTRERQNLRSMASALWT